MGLSEPVEAAVDEAIQRVESLISQLLDGHEIKFLTLRNNKETGDGTI
jgi:hypothetical protein